MARRARRRLVSSVIMAAALTLGLLPFAAPSAAIAVAGSGYSWALDGAYFPNLDRHGTDADSTIAMFSSSSTTAWVQITTASSFAETFRFELSSGSDPMKVGTYTIGDGFGSTILVRQVGSIGCQMTAGSFTVLEITHDGSGGVTNLAARVEASCNPFVSVVADLRFHSAIAYPALGYVNLQAFPHVPATGTGTNDLVIRSEGTGPLTISSVTLEGADVVDFAIDHETCTAGPLAVGSTCTVTIAWTATKANEFVTIVSDNDSARAVAKVGLGGEWGPPLAANAVSFGQVLYGNTVGPLPIVVTNEGGTSIDVTDFGIGGFGPEAFTITDNGCEGATLAPSATCTIQVAATPTEARGYAGDLNVWASPYPILHVPLSVEGIYRPADWTRSSIHNATADYTYEGGNALGRTVTAGGTAYLHAIANGTRVGTTPVKDGGPYSPVYYTRGNGAGTSWTSALRLNPSTQHGLWPGLASADASVYASWVKVPKVVSFSTSAARSIQFRANSNHGSSGAWGAVRTLTSATGRVDYPTIAAAGADVYVAYTDANSGSVRLLTSHNRGATWSNLALGTTSATSTAGGKTGLPSVAASGRTVIVAWIADGNGAVRARISQDAGAHWTATANLAAGSLSYPAAAATTGRVGVAWIGLEPTVAIWTAKGRWSAPIEVPNVNHTWLEVIYGPSLVLTGWSTLGVGYSGCIQNCFSSTTNTDLESDYAESPNNGADWYNGSSIPIGSPQDGRRASDGVSVLASSATKREFLFTYWQPGTSSTRVVHRTITITPTDGPGHVITPRRPSPIAGATSDGSAPPASALRTREPYRT